METENSPIDVAGEIEVMKKSQLPEFMNSGKGRQLIWKKADNPACESSTDVKWKKEDLEEYVNLELRMFL